VHAKRVGKRNEKCAESSELDSESAPRLTATATLAQTQQWLWFYYYI